MAEQDNGEPKSESKPSFVKNLGRGLSGQVDLCKWRGEQVVAKYVRDDVIDSERAGQLANLEQEAEALNTFKDDPRFIQLKGTSETPSGQFCLLLEPLLPEDDWHELSHLNLHGTAEKVGAIHEICEVWNTLVEKNLLDRFEFRPKSFFYNPGIYGYDINVKAFDFNLPKDLLHKNSDIVASQKERLFFTLLSVLKGKDIDDLSVRELDEKNRYGHPENTWEEEFKETDNPEFKKLMKRCLDNFINKPELDKIDINALIGLDLQHQYAAEAMEAMEALSTTDMIKKIIARLEKKWPDSLILRGYKNDLIYLEKLERKNKAK